MTEVYQDQEALDESLDGFSNDPEDQDQETSEEEAPEEPEASADSAKEQFSPLGPPVEQRRLPWAGITTGHAPQGQLLTSEQMLEEAGLNWDVDVRSLYQQMNDGQFREHPWAREVYRTDTETPLGVVKTRYKLITNRQMFEFGDKIVEDGEGHWAEAGTQGDGRRVFMTMKLNDDFNIAGDGYDVYIFFASSHDGTVSLSASTVPFRVVCLNQTQLVNATARARWKMQHTTTLAQKEEEARASLQLARTYLNDSLRPTLESFAGTPIDNDNARYQIEHTVPSSRPKRQAVIDGIMNVYENSPTVESYRGTAYGLFNALTEYYDHVLRRRSGNARFATVMFGEASQARRILGQRLAALN